MHKQEQLGSGAKTIHPGDDMKQLAGFFLILLRVSERTIRRVSEASEKQANPENIK